MIYFNGGVVVATVILAIISRKHYSKYKDGKGIRVALMAMLLAMGYGVWTLLCGVLPLEGLKEKLMEQLRKNQIVSNKRLELITDTFIARSLGAGVIIMFAFNLLEIGSTITRDAVLNGENIIVREEYGGDVVREELRYEVSGQEKIVVLDVSPVRLSEEEFYERANEVADEIADRYFEEGNVFSQDIELPLSDSEGVFHISWVSETPNIISSRGRIKTQLSSEAVEAHLRMFISYYDYSADYVIKVLIGKKEISQDEKKIQELEQALDNLEQDTVEEKEFLIPDSINGIEIRLADNRKSGSFSLLGVVIAIVVIGISISRLREEVRERDKRLMKEYPYFVDSLWLYIEAGMNIKRALKQYVYLKEKETENADDGEDILTGELRYTINQMDNGESEYIAYEELGARLNLPVYVSLMRHISQNIRMGTKDLRVLMETEVSMALESKKEAAKRQGEEASTKLVFPMILLLLVVMIMIMTPAFMGF